jgi:leader peptidase (prepilin peptidase) / N-methyltransferase
VTTTAAAPILVRAPLRLRPVDLAGVPLAVATGWAVLSAGAAPVAALPLAAAAAAAPALARIDLAERRLPNAITLPLLALAALAGAIRVAAGDLSPLVGVGCGGVLLLMAVVGGMGMGDVKLGTALALATATLGWGAPVTGLAASIVVGGVAGTIALAVGRRSLAFGPWLLVGHALAGGLALAAAL